MSGEWIVSLASSGALTLVNAAATDAWQSARSGFLRLLGHGAAERERVTANRLDESAAQLGRAAEDRQDQVREELLHAWRTRLVDLLEERPDAAEEMQALIEQIQAMLPTAQRQGGQAVGTGPVFQANSGGVNIGITGVAGDITLHGEPRRHEA
ncbi:hypothetical protein OIE52_35110 [Streptomyces canus]|uniref:hypothetical protein n=1 Tax=Streptomyces canus TaxID=58343 RepID=UPI00324CBE19